MGNIMILEGQMEKIENADSVIVITKDNKYLIAKSKEKIDNVIRIDLSTADFDNIKSIYTITTIDSKINRRELECIYGEKCLIGVIGI